MAHIHRMTEAELFASFLALSNYLERVELVAAGPVIAIDGVQLILCDTTGGGFTVTLDDPGPDAAPARWNPIIINVGSNTLTVDPQTALINGIAGTQTIGGGGFGAYSFVHDGTDFRAADPLLPSFSLTNIPSYVLEYNVAAMDAAGEIWQELARSTLAVDGSIVGSCDASFVTTQAATTPQGNVVSEVDSQPVLRTSGGGLPPSGDAYLEMRPTIDNRGGLSTDWVDIPPLDALVAGNETAFSIAFVASFPLGEFGRIFEWRGSDQDPGERSSFQLSIDAAGQLQMTMINDDNDSTALADSGANLVVASGFKTYIMVYTGTVVTVYEDAAALLGSVAFDVDPTFLSFDVPASGIGIGFGQVGINGPVNSCEMDLLTMVYFDDAMTAAEITAANDFLNDEFGL